MSPVSLVAQVADVSTPLGSVYKMVQNDNIVHFERGNSYIQHKATGKKTPMKEVRGAYEIGIWVPDTAAQSEGDFTGQDM